MSESSQKVIGRNRAPRVQIEYDVEIGGAERKVQLPFVMGVLADLYGKHPEAPVKEGDAEKPRPPVAERKFLDFDGDNLDERMRRMRPRVRFRVQNQLTGEGELPVDLTFESMDQFLPDAVARNIEPLRELLDARTQLSNLLTYLDGKTKAEQRMAELLKNPALLQALASTPNQQPVGDEGAGEQKATT